MDDEWDDEEHDDEEQEDGDDARRPGSSSWREPAICPDCGSEETRFMESRYESSVYQCERCGASFEIEG